MKILALIVYLLVWWQVMVALQPVLYALDDWAVSQQAIAIVVATEWGW